MVLIHVETIKYTQRKSISNSCRDNEIKEQLQTYLVFGNETECQEERY